MITIPQYLDRLFDQILLCELTTIGPHGPMPTPMQHAWIGTRGVFVLSSAIGVRAKLDRIQRNPQVCLSFTDFTGSDLDAPEAVLVQGLATITQKATGVAGLEDFWAVNLRKKPDQRTASFVTDIRHDGRRLFYLRARIEVEPVRIRVQRGRPGRQVVEEIGR